MLPRKNPEISFPGDILRQGHQFLCVSIPCFYKAASTNCEPSARNAITKTTFEKLKTNSAIAPHSKPQQSHLIPNTISLRLGQSNKSQLNAGTTALLAVCGHQNNSRDSKAKKKWYETCDNEKQKFASAPVDEQRRDQQKTNKTAYCVDRSGDIVVVICIAWSLKPKRSVSTNCYCCCLLLHCFLTRRIDKSRNAFMWLIDAIGEWWHGRSSGVAPFGVIAPITLFRIWDHARDRCVQWWWWGYVTRRWWSLCDKPPRAGWPTRWLFFGQRVSVMRGHCLVVAARIDAGWSKAWAADTVVEGSVVSGLRAESFD